MVHKQLYDHGLLRLWRTGANLSLFCPDEDGDIDVSRYMYM